ncbi:uncharacterized protein PHACADRAFT_261138 [Phanerochaete carnosa HHB-10118-sp]|uniref:Uncharacterized protein n=1 Tax=Phanerochaete carnosa (strain HHB-10118-sp) TaxID=650164 RepID=K5WQG9_PHACS|nr:uncharacterized protein PHACADRAFT_261138 [Phanerochaete carnosa HHB-10118-sp]EKM52602.1 hypothetical protein PHACADRAFT_261138 [Phanerochaete carnosa HHB-10118-sp]
MSRSKMREGDESRRSRPHHVLPELSSDSDFLADMRHEESKLVKKRRTRRKTGQLGEDESYSIRKGSASKATVSKMVIASAGHSRRLSSALSHNPLFKYFGNLGIDVASDSEESQKELEDDTQILRFSNKDDEVEQDREGSSEPEILPRTLAIVLEDMKVRSQSSIISAALSTEDRPQMRSEPELSPPKQLKRKWAPRKARQLSPFKRPRFETSSSALPAAEPHLNHPAEANDSTTEPEPDAEPMATPLPESTNLTAVDGEDESVTEPEPEPESRLTQQANAEDDSETAPESEVEPNGVQAQKVDDDGSVTRPESDAEGQLSDESSDDDSKDEDNDWGPRHRPAFPLNPGQLPLGPFALSESHVHVPSASADGKPPDLNDHSNRKPRVIRIPASANTHLRDYQRKGVEVMCGWYFAGRGGCLGDDMGLGKTVQISSFLSAIMEKTGTPRDLNRRYKYISKLQDEVIRKRPKGQVVRDWEKELPRADARWPTALIIVPSSLIGNWERELETWGYFEVGTYTSNIKAETRENVLRDFRLGRLDMLLTTHELARDQVDRFESLAISIIFVDEAHKVKDPTRKITKAFNRFQCKRRVAVTGTAIQNNYDELWALLDWTNPGALGSIKQWQRYVSKPLTRGQSKSATADEKLRGIMVSKILKEEFLPRFFIRRTKELLKDQLPKKTDEVVFCPLTPKQTEVYRRIIESEPVQNLVRKDECCDCGSRKKRAQCCHKFDKADLFRYMSALIKISNHLALILPSPTDTPDQVVRNKALAKVAFGDGYIPSYGPAMLVPQYCGKWLVLETLLQEWQKDASNKVLIFTKSVKLLEMLEFHLKSQSVGFVKLDGSIKQPDRMPLIDRFHEDSDVFVFLISTLAGGTGLNLTGANKVVIFDPNWNPAHDLQAMDRAYRIGQKRDVSIYRFLGAGSLEELIYARQIYKQQQMAVGYDASLQTRYFEGVQGDKSRQGELFGIRNIFGLAEGEVRTKMTIEKATLTDLDWALANMDAKVKQPATKVKDKWVYEAEVKGKKEDVDLRGLGAFLFDDDAPAVDDQEDEISKTLKDVGVTYTHRNEALIVDNAIEGERIKVLMESRKKARKQSKAVGGGNKHSKGKEPVKKDDDWPPKRGGRKLSSAPQMSRLLQRRAALVGLGMISENEGVYKFAEEFRKMSKEQQEELLHQLDERAKRSSNASTLCSGS